MAKSKLILENSDLSWDENRRYKVNAIVFYNGNNWQNLTGENSEPGVGSDWFQTSADLGSKLDKGGYTGTAQDLKDEIDLKLNIADYNDRFKGKFTTLLALETAFPTAETGDYAQVDSGAGSDVVNYNWDDEDGWIEGGSGSAATNTDMLPEGSVNLYFTTARVLATVLSGISFATGGAIVSTDSILVAFGKIQRQITDLITVISDKLDKGGYVGTAQDLKNEIDLKTENPQITITTAVSITTATNDASGIGQKGKNVIIDNGANAINLTVNGGAGFVSSYVKHGTGAITFVQGSGRSLVLVDGTAVLNGIAGSTATISSVGATDYLRISNA